VTSISSPSTRTPHGSNDTDKENLALSRSFDVIRRTVRMNFAVDGN